MLVKEGTADGYNFSVSLPYAAASCICLLAYSSAPTALPAIAGKTSPITEASPRPPRITAGPKEAKPVGG